MTKDVLQVKMAEISSSVPTWPTSQDVQECCGEWVHTDGGMVRKTLINRDILISNYVSREEFDRCFYNCVKTKADDDDDDDDDLPKPAPPEKKKERRYDAWAGTGIPKEWVEFGFENPSGVVWPIVDNETCGPIEGWPRPEQWYAVVFDSDEQARICRLLNQQEERERDEG